MFDATEEQQSVEELELQARLSQLNATVAEAHVEVAEVVIIIIIIIIIIISLL